MTAENFRPHYHFTAQAGWLNDPNGLVYVDGVWHLFYQWSPLETAKQWGTRGWGHAVSRDLVHWEHKEPALSGSTEQYGGAFSGTAIVDERNTLGLQEPGAPPVLCAFFTGSSANAQFLAVSVDGGDQWNLHESNPVVPSLPREPGTPGAADRDPKVFWHEQSGHYVMVLFRIKGEGDAGFQILISENLLEWTLTDYHMGFFECPDLFELALDETADKRTWVLMDAMNDYRPGDFDGRRFRPSTPQRKAAHGQIYAGQTWNHSPDGRRVQMTWVRWMAGEQPDRFPDMPFDQMMTIPVELSLRGEGDEAQLCRWPVRELEALRGRPVVDLRKRQVADETLLEVEGVALELEFAGRWTEGGGLCLRFQGQELQFSTDSSELTVAGQTMPVHPTVGGDVRLRMFVDRNVVEVFAGQGESSLAAGFRAKPGTDRLEVEVQGKVMLDLLRVWPLI